MEVPGLIDIGAAAFWRWLQVGGGMLFRRLSRRRATAARTACNERRARALEAAQVGLRHFTSGLSCSGGPLPLMLPAEERLVVLIAGRRKRTREEGLWDRGLRAGKRGRWAVADVLSVRRAAPVGREWEALVSWVGPFDPEWLPLKNLCGLAKKEALALRRLEGSRTSEARRRTVGSGEKEAPRIGVRRNPRLAILADFSLGARHEGESPSNEGEGISEMASAGPRSGTAA